MIEFDSDRKMMTVIAKNLKTEKIYVFSKGADSSMLPKIKDRSTAA
jgi:magnesium-transporting ATPase (P-type)